MSSTGILGGTFDPPHVAHAAMARAALERLGLDRVVLMPAAAPPHKALDPLTEFRHRLAMARIEAGRVPGVEASAFEQRRDGPSYTVDLLDEFAREHPGTLYFIMGSDSLRDMASWRDPEGILRRCTLVVFPRPGFAAILPVPAPADVVVFEEPEIEVSSTMVRERLRRGETVEGLVSDAVLSYIDTHRLYTG